jgi:hypothetical protein
MRKARLEVKGTSLHSCLLTRSIFYTPWIRHLSTFYSTKLQPKLLFVACGSPARQRPRESTGIMSLQRDSPLSPVSLNWSVASDNDAPMPASRGSRSPSESPTIASRRYASTRAGNADDQPDTSTAGFVSGSNEERDSENDMSTTLTAPSSMHHRSFTPFSAKLLHGLELPSTRRKCSSY